MKNNEEKKTNRYIFAKLLITDDVSEDIKLDIMTVLRQTVFNKISYPLTTYKGNFIAIGEDEPNKARTIGYIVDYNIDTDVFKLTVFNNSKEMIEGFNDYVIVPEFISTKDGKLRTITRLVLASKLNVVGEDVIIPEETEPVE